MNRTVAFIVLGVAAFIVLGGQAFIAIADGTQYAAERFTRDGLTILGVLAAAGGLAYQQARTNETVEQVKRQTNGTLTSLMERNNELAAELAATRELLAAERSEVAPPTLSSPVVRDVETTTPPPIV